MPRIVLLSEGLTGRTYELKAEKTTVGRVEDNIFQIPDGSISSHHCEIVLRGNEVLVRDLNSTNGSFINGDRITEAVLKPGHILRLGMVEMRLETGEPAAAKKTAGKSALEHTIVIPQGVKLNELEGPRTGGFEGKTGFEKKSNKASRIFIVAAVIVGFILVVLLVIVAAGGFKPS
jgi:pSer/pThr/pTyr-binding forkhead associated (FHA) protein